MVCRQLYAPWIEHRADMTFGPSGLPLPSAVSVYRSKSYPIEQPAWERSTAITLIDCTTMIAAPRRESNKITA
jgi:hypothetical protein